MTFKAVQAFSILQHKILLTHTSTSKIWEKLTRRAKAYSISSST